MSLTPSSYWGLDPLVCWVFLKHPENCPFVTKMLGVNFLLTTPYSLRVSVQTGDTACLLCCSPILPFLWTDTCSSILTTFPYSLLAGPHWHRWFSCSSFDWGGPHFHTGCCSFSLQDFGSRLYFVIFHSIGIWAGFLQKFFPRLLLRLLEGNFGQNFLLGGSKMFHRNRTRYVCPSSAGWECPCPRRLLGLFFHLPEQVIC